MKEFAFRIDDLEIAATASPGSAILNAFFAGYDRAFVLPREKESLEGFRACLALNSDPDYQRLSVEYGGFCEIILIAHKVGDGGFVGGANFIAFPCRDRDAPGTINLNYIFVAAGYRGLGHLRRLLRAVRRCSGLAFEEDNHQSPLVFLEQNDPFRMSMEDFQADTIHSGIDQFDRLAIWSKLGAKIVDFPYVQPALSKMQEPDDSLAYAVLDCDAGALDACILRQHLERFFAISVMKGAASPREDRVAARQIDELARACDGGEVIALLQLHPVLREAKTPSLREALRKFNT